MIVRPTLPGRSLAPTTATVSGRKMASSPTRSYPRTSWAGSAFLRFFTALLSSCVRRLERPGPCYSDTSARGTLRPILRAPAFVTRRPMPRRERSHPYARSALTNRILAPIEVLPARGKTRSSRCTDWWRPRRTSQNRHGFATIVFVSYVRCHGRYFVDGLSGEDGGSLWA